MTPLIIQNNKILLVGNKLAADISCCCGFPTPPIPSLQPALIPTFSSTTANSSGFIAQISNYNSTFYWTGTATESGNVSISGTGLVTVTGVAANTRCKATIYTSRAGYGTGSAIVTATTLA